MRDLSAHIDLLLKPYKDFQLFIGCSGGVDSLLLTKIMHTLEYNVNVLHVNYQLRGVDSDLDAEFVKEFCKAHAIPFQQSTVNLSAQLKNGGNLQELARDFRYDWFKKIKQEDRNNRIVLAHHADDQIETFFLNIARKSGVMGLSCMPFEHNRILRPLLDISKSELIETAKQVGLNWREDVSNRDSKYRRNLLRNIILPQLSKSIPQLNESVLTMIQVFQDKSLELQEKVQPLINTVLKNSKFSIDEYSALDEFERIEFFRLLNQRHTIVEEVDRLLVSQKGKKIELNYSDEIPFISIVKEDRFLALERNSHLDSFSLATEKISQLPTSFNKHEVFLDPELIEGELILRRWDKGDRINPIGMKGSKLISDIISDAKLSINEKNSILVLHDDTTIHWCVGLTVGAKAVANNTSKQILKCSVTYSIIQE